MNKTMCILFSILLLLGCSKTTKIEDVNLNLQLVKAVINGDNELVNDLCEKGASPNTNINEYIPSFYKYSNNYYIVEYCINNNSVEILKTLMQHNVLLDRKDNNGIPYWAICLSTKKYDVFNLLITDPGLLECIKSDCFVWKQFVYYWDSDFTPKIITKIFGDEYCIPDDNSVLIESITSRNSSCFKYLVNYGVNPFKEYYNEFNDEMITPLSYVNREIKLMEKNHIDAVIEKDENESAYNELLEIEQFLNELLMENEL